MPSGHYVHKSVLKRLMDSTDNKERSGPHRRVEKLLDEININYISEQSFPPYKCDIYFPEWHLVVEIDGPHHWRQRTKDRMRDEYLMVHYGLRLLRLDARQWIRSAKIQGLIKQFIEEHEPTYWKRKQICPILP